MVDTFAEMHSKILNYFLSPSGGMVDAGDLKSPSFGSVGSSPTSGTKFMPTRKWWNGRHAGLRSQCRKACGFESHFPHQLSKNHIILRFFSCLK